MRSTAVMTCRIVFVSFGVSLCTMIVYHQSTPQKIAVSKRSGHVQSLTIGSKHESFGVENVGRRFSSGKSYCCLD